MKVPLQLFIQTDNVNELVYVIPKDAKGVWIFDSGIGLSQKDREVILTFQDGKFAGYNIPPVLNARARVALFAQLNDIITEIEDGEKEDDTKGVR